MHTLLRHTAAGTLLLVLAGSAAAHAGHGGHASAGVLAGLAHPFGADHLLAMVAVGAWSARVLPVARRWAGPALFLLAMVAGALLGALGLVLPGVELGVASSVLLLGVMLAAGGRVPVPVGLLLVAGAALLHGLAHGAEGPAGAGFAPYALGFLVTTALLHTTGLGLGLWLDRAFGVDRQAARNTAHNTAHNTAWRLAGAGLGAAGLLLMARA